MYLSAHPPCTSPENAQVWQTYLNLEPRYRTGGFDLFEAVANQLNLSLEVVVEIIYQCGECAQRRRCPGSTPPSALA